MLYKWTISLKIDKDAMNMQLQIGLNEKKSKIQTCYLKQQCRQVLFDIEYVHSTPVTHNVESTRSNQKTKLRRECFADLCILGLTSALVQNYWAIELCK